MRSEHGNNQIDFHESLLFPCQVHIGFQLWLNSLSKLPPVQVANQVFDLVLVDLISFLEGIDIQFNQVLILNASGDLDSRTTRILYVIHNVIKTIDHVKFLDFEPNQVILVTPILLGQGEGFSQSVNGVLEELFLYLDLT